MGRNGRVVFTLWSLIVLYNAINVDDLISDSMHENFQFLFL
jgi:hypothetical protein